MRARLAQLLVCLLIVMSLSLIGLTAFDALTDGEAKDLIAGLFSPLIALTGTALGFYYGGHRNGE